MNITEKMNVLVSRFRNIGIDDFVISAGAGLFLHGLREKFDDIDIACNDAIFDEMLAQGCVSHYAEVYVVEIITIEDLNIDIHRDAVTAAKPSITIEGVRVLTLEELLKEKEKLFDLLGREKDMKDIINIQKAIESR